MLSMGDEISVMVTAIDEMVKSGFPGRQFLKAGLLKKPKKKTAVENHPVVVLVVAPVVIVVVIEMIAVVTEMTVVVIEIAK